MPSRPWIPILLGVLAMVLIPAAGADAPSPQSRLLTDFSGRGDHWGWLVVNDGVMGGRSRGGFTVVAGVMRFSGSTNTDGGGFSSVRTGALQLDLGGFEGIRSPSPPTAAAVVCSSSSRRRRTTPA